MLGVIVLLCGVLTIAVGVSMSSATFVFFPNMQHFTAYLFAGVGGLLCARRGLGDRLGHRQAPP